MSYQKMNQVTRPFSFSIPCLYDKVKDINTEAKYFIDVDMYIGYWHVVVEEEAREIMSFFAPGGNHWCNLMLMGSLKAALIFVAMMMKLQMKWETLAKEHRKKNLQQK